MVKSAGGEPFRWLLEPGRSYLVCSSGARTDITLLDHLAGRRQDKRLSISRETPGGLRQPSGLPSAGLLPPPGNEIFVGTTVGEQLKFFAAGDLREAVEQTGLDRLFAFDFAGRPERSVWELGAGERRCLLLVSQALAGPRVWVLHQPLARMDELRVRAVREFIGLRCGLGDTVIAGSPQPEALLGCCPDLLALSDGDGRLCVDFHGSGPEAARFLAGRSGIPLRVLEAAIGITGSGE